LYVVFGGANDFFNLQSNPAIPANNITSAVSDLADAGARRILVVDLPNLGLTPAFRGTAYQAGMTQLSAGFNAYLSAGLQTIPGALLISGDADKLAHPGWSDNAGLTIFHFPLNQMFEDMIAHPADYNLTNVVDPVFNGTTLVGDPNTYLFWDTVHPTSVPQAALGDAAFTLVAVPEPGTLCVLLLGGAWLLGRRRTCWQAK
jgi:thermolabile hemolysin